MSQCISELLVSESSFKSFFQGCVGGCLSTSKCRSWVGGLGWRGMVWARLCWSSVVARLVAWPCLCWVSVLGQCAAWVNHLFVEFSPSALITQLSLSCLAYLTISPSMRVLCWWVTLWLGVGSHYSLCGCLLVCARGCVCMRVCMCVHSFLVMQVRVQVPPGWSEGQLVTVAY